jgi:hypothetical protein
MEPPLQRRRLVTNEEIMNVRRMLRGYMNMGQPDLIAKILSKFDVPTLYTICSDPELSEYLVRTNVYKRIWRQRFGNDMEEAVYDIIPKEDKDKGHQLNYLWLLLGHDAAERYKTTRSDIRLQSYKRRFVDIQKDERTEVEFIRHGEKDLFFTWRFVTHDDPSFYSTVHALFVIYGRDIQKYIKHGKVKVEFDHIKCMQTIYLMLLFHEDAHIVYIHSDEQVYIRSCFVCKNPAESVCSQCDQVSYCGESCQKQHWNKGHGKECMSKK